MLAQVEAKVVTANLIKPAGAGTFMGAEQKGQRWKVSQWQQRCVADHAAREAAGSAGRDELAGWVVIGRSLGNGTAQLEALT